MLIYKKLFGFFRIIVALTLLFLSTMFVSITIYVLFFLKKAMFLFNLNDKVHIILSRSANLWAYINRLILKYISGTNIILHGNQEINEETWYLMLPNHRSWADIITLFSGFNLINHRIVLKFFLKRQLLWQLPFGGIACWFLDYPFLGRYKKADFRKKPSLRFKDISIIKKSCNKFKQMPCIPVIFAEGTRFNKNKNNIKGAKFKNLLAPKSTALDTVIKNMRNNIDSIIDLTMIYKTKREGQEITLFNILSGRITDIDIFYRIVKIPDTILSLNTDEKLFKSEIQKFINILWQEKDNLIQSKK